MSEVNSTYNICFIALLPDSGDKAGLLLFRCVINYVLNYLDNSEGLGETTKNMFHNNNTITLTVNTQKQPMRQNMLFNSALISLKFLSLHNYCTNRVTLVAINWLGCFKRCRLHYS